MISDEAVEAAKEAMLGAVGGCHPGEDWEEWRTRVTKLALEAAAPYMQPAVSEQRTWCVRHRCCREANHEAACEVDESELTAEQMQAIRDSATPNPYRSQA